MNLENKSTTKRLIFIFYSYVQRASTHTYRSYYFCLYLSTLYIYIYTLNIMLRKLPYISYPRGTCICYLSNICLDVRPSLIYVELAPSPPKIDSAIGLNNKRRAVYIYIVYRYIVHMVKTVFKYYDIIIYILIIHLI